MQRIAEKAWKQVMVISMMLVFAGLALADENFTILTFDEPIAVTEKGAPVTPGTLAATVDLSPEQLKALSGSGELAIYGPEMLISREQILDMPESRSIESKAQSEALDAGRAWMNIRGRLVNNRDFWSENSRTLAVTQSEVSAAVYGNHIVVGWNDFATALLGPFPSIANWAVSHDGGQTFTASLTGLPTDALILETNGDPAIEADAKGTFYYTTLATLNINGTPTSAIVVYRSLDSGDSFSPWQAIIFRSSDFLDKPMMAVDQSSGKVYVAFTLFPSGFPGTGIVLWDVTDEGTTVIATSTSISDILQGPDVEVGADSTVYVAYEAGFQSGNPSIKLKRSTDKFASEIDVSRGGLIPGAIIDASLFCGRDAIKGNIRFNEFPSLAADLRTGDLYLVFNARDRLSGFLEIFLTRSTDGGKTWSTPMVASDRRPGDSSDKFFPWVAVTANGTIAIIYNDRSVKPLSRMMGFDAANWYFAAYLKRFYVSGNVLTALRTARRIGRTSPVTVNNDLGSVCYMAEYNSVAVDRALQSNAIFLSWGDNRNGDPDIFFYRTRR